MVFAVLQAALDKVLGSHDLMGAPLLVVANKQVIVGRGGVRGG